MAKGKYEEWLTPDGITRLEAWARDGLTDEQIANNMGVSIATLYNYKRDHLVILEALKRGKEVVDIQIENALFKRASGYYFTEEVSTKNGIERIEKYSHPDTTAQIFWLKNRKPKEWRDKQEMDLAIKELPKIVLKRSGD
jgi:transcriptional regulator with XRE-family HTH domain